MSTSDIIATISIILTVAVPLFIWVRRKYFIRPELTLELKSVGGHSSPQGFSHKNIPIDGVIEMNTALQIFRIQWDANILIRNNSDYTAYYPEILFRNDNLIFYKLDYLNIQDSIASTELVKLKGEYAEFEECVGIERTRLGNDLPLSFENFQILLKYRNSAKHKFYTLYSHKDKSNKFLYNQPKGFVSKIF